MISKGPVELSGWGHLVKLWGPDLHLMENCSMGTGIAIPLCKGKTATPVGLECRTSNPMGQEGGTANQRLFLSLKV